MIVIPASVKPERVAGASAPDLSPARMPGVYAQGLCRTQSPQSVLIGIENKHFFEKTDFFYKLK